ncbi:MAG: NIPSNAP family protein, partial [Chloroflexi bacterium]|nr:NIPSNAP family protein [Chloroflexota bacterium]
PMDDQHRPHPVRNDVAQPGQEIVTLRYFRIKKGTFDQFVKVSVESIWPYYEKLGSRVIGMWKAVTPPEIEGLPVGEEQDYDEVYLSTRYASAEHWKASREPMRHGGNGPDWQKCKAALDFRASLTITRHVTFLQGQMAPNGPYFMPALDEVYEEIHPDA